MHILIAVASRHSGTTEIAAAIGQELRTAGHAVDVRDVEESPTVEPYDAALIGSAIYMGNWLPEARQFVERNQVALTRIPVWLFSSGPVGEEEPRRMGEPNHLDKLLLATGARNHRVFAGKLDKSKLGLGERLITRVVNVPEGDFRDWEAIRGWAHEIATAVLVSTTADV